MRHTEETRRRIAEAKRGKPRDAETRRAISAGLKRYHVRVRLALAKEESR
jgi:hypothetical protein